MTKNLALLAVIISLLFAAFQSTPSPKSASAQDGPFSVAWDELEVIKLDNFRRLTKLYSVNLGEGSVSTLTSFFGDGQLSIAAALYYRDRTAPITETIFLIQANEAAVEIVPLQNLESAVVFDMDLSKTGEFLSISTANTTELWNIRTREHIATLDKAKSEALGLPLVMYSADFHPLTDRLTTANEYYLVQWDAQLESPVETQIIDYLFIVDVDFSPTGDKIAIGHMAGMVVIDLENPNELGGFVSGEPSKSIMFNADGSIVGYISDGGYEVGLHYVAEDETIIIVYPGYNQSGTDITFNADGQLFMIAMPHSLEFYNAATAGNRGRLTNYEGMIQSLSASTDGRFLMTGHANGDLNIWGVPIQK